MSTARRLHLRKLHVPWCQQAVTDDVLASLAKDCRELEDLNICGVKGVTAAAIEQLIIRCNIGKEMLVIVVVVVGVGVVMEVLVVVDTLGSRGGSSRGRAPLDLP